MKCSVVVICCFVVFFLVLRVVICLVIRVLVGFGVNRCWVYWLIFV